MRIVNLRTLPYGPIINPDIKLRRLTFHMGKQGLDQAVKTSAQTEFVEKFS